MKSEQQIKIKLEQIKTDFIETFSYDKEQRNNYRLIYTTLKWVLEETKETKEIEDELKNEEFNT